MKRAHHSKTRVIVTWTIATVLSLGLFFAIYFTREILDYRALSDATFIPSALLLAVGVLNLISRSGTFDTAAYSFAAIGQRFRPREQQRYKDAYDYKLQADERRSKKGGYVLPYFSWGFLLLIVAIIANILSLQS